MNKSKKIIKSKSNYGKLILSMINKNLIGYCNLFFKNTRE